MIKMATERVVALGRAPRHFPRRRNGKRPHVATIHRWAKHGVRADDGTVVPLETIRVGRTLCTSVEAIQRFCERLGAGRGPAFADRAVATNPDRDTALEIQALARGL
jgi:hypothetical protein